MTAGSQVPAGGRPWRKDAASEANRGSHLSAIGASLPGTLREESAHARRAQPRAARRRRARRRTAAHRRRRRHRQDRHARAPRRAPHRPRRRPAAHPAAHLHAPRRRRDAAPRRGAPGGAAGIGAGGVAARASGAAPSTPSPRACCASTRATSAWSPTSPSWTAATPRTSCTSPARRSGSAAAARASRRSPRASTSTRAASTRSCRCPRSCARRFPWCQPAEAGLAQLFAALHRRQGGAAGARLRRPAALLARPARRPGRPARACASASTTCWSTSIQDTNALQADIVSLLRPGRHRRHLRRRRRPGHLRLPRRHGAQHPRLRAALPGRRGASRSRATTAPRRRSSRPPTRSSPRPPSAATRSSGRTRTDGGRPVLATCRDEDEQTQWLCERILEHREQGTRAQAARPCCSAPSTTPWRSRWSSRGATSRSTSTAACASSRWRTSRTSWPSCAWPRTRATPWPACACSAWCPASGPRRRRRCSRALGAAGGDFPAAWARRPRPRARARRLAGRRRALRARSPQPAPATCRRRSTPCAASTGRCSSAATTTSRRACATSSRSRRSRPARETRSQFLAELVLDPPAYTQELAGPPLLDEDYLILSHHALGQGPRVRRRLRHPRRRRQHPVGHGHRQRRRDRRGAPPALRRLHARPRAALRHPPAALLHAAVGQGRHARLRAALALPHRRPCSRTSSRSRRGRSRSRARRLPSSASPPPSIRAGVRSLWEAPAET